ncbi:MAG: hypothetical protein GXO77_08725 [Calditrichaeota bacterium]|nr:hypothetical protein [Calditrichota bacterium]
MKLRTDIHPRYSRCFSKIVLASIALTFLVSNSLFAQFSGGSYYLAGYAMGKVSSGAAYGYKNVSGKTYKLNYYKDSFTHGSLSFKYMRTYKGGYFGMDFDLIGTLIAAMTGALSRNFDMTSFPGTGVWRDMEKNLGKHKISSEPKLYSTGTDFTYGTLDLLFGDGSRKYGFHFGFNGVGGNDDDEYNKIRQLSNSQNFRYLTNKIFFTLGPAYQFYVNDNFFLLSRVNLIWGLKDNGVREFQSNTWGYEIYPTARYIFGGRLGLFADAFVKYRHFFALDAVVEQANLKENITVPGFSTTQIGIALGVYFRE